MAKRYGQGRVFLRGKRWWIAYYAPVGPGGKAKEVREAGGDTEGAAVSLLNQRLDELAAHRLGAKMFRPPATRKTTINNLLSELETEYQVQSRKSIRHMASRIKRLRLVLGEFRAEILNANDLRTYVQMRQRQGAALATIKLDLATLHRAFTLGLDAGTVPDVPRFPTLTVLNARKGFFERAEFEAVVHCLPAWAADVAWFGYMTGWRRSEIIGLAWDNIDLDGQVMRLWEDETKNSKPRLVALVGELYELVLRRWQQRAVGDAIVPWVFHRAGRQVAKATLRDAWTKACTQAGVAGRLFHDMRRTAVRNMIRAGVDRSIAMEISGHKTEAVFARYNIVNEEDTRQALRKTLAYLAGQERSLNVSKFKGTGG